jgi:hypothetical protein
MNRLDKRHPRFNAQLGLPLEYDAKYIRRSNEMAIIIANAK